MIGGPNGGELCEFVVPQRCATDDNNTVGRGYDRRGIDRDVIEVIIIALSPLFGGCGENWPLALLRTVGALFSFVERLCYGAPR